MDNPTFLLNIHKPSTAAHLWDDGDTYCRMYSTSGLKQQKYQVSEQRGNRRICKMCNDVFEQYSGYQISSND